MTVQTAYQAQTAPIIIGSVTHTTNGSIDSLPTPTLSGTTRVSAYIEISATDGGLLNARMTTTERDALTAYNGLQIYNTTTNTLDSYYDGAWVHLNEAGGDVTFDSIENGLGTVLLPSYTFTGDTNTGMWSSGADTVDFSAGGIQTLRVSETVLGKNSVNIYPGLTGEGANIAVLLGAAETNVGLNLIADGDGSIGIRAVGATKPALLDLWYDFNGFRTRISSGTLAANMAITLPTTDATANASSTASYVPVASNTAGIWSFANQGVRYSEMTLTAANIKGMFAAGVTVIPAPGANLAIIVHGMEYQQFFLTDAYAAGGAVYLNYGATGAGTDYATISTGIPAGFVTGVAANSSLIYVGGTIKATTGLVVGSVANTAVCITNADGAFTSATGGTARVKVWYSIVATT